MLRGVATPEAPGAGRGGHGAGDATNRVPYCEPGAVGVPPPRDFEQRWHAGETMKALMARYGVTRDRVRGWVKTLGLKRPKNGRPRVKRLDWWRRAFRQAWDRGDSAERMAVRFGLTARRVLSLRGEMGLTPRIRRGPAAAEAETPAAEPPPVVISAASIEAPKMTMARPEWVRECCYVVSGPPWLYCGAATERGRSMCEAHRASCLARAA